MSPATVAVAYRALRERGLVAANRRRGTVVTSRPPLAVRRRIHVPAGVRDLASGNPDPALLPPLGPALARLDPEPVLYGAPARLPQLVELAHERFAADGVQGEIALASGALDAIERVLQAQLRPGDRVAVEDPTWPRVTDLVSALALQALPVPVDERGLLPDDLERALDAGVRAVIVTPRGQNPTGAAVDRGRGRRLREVLARRPEVLVVEDDYAAGVAGAPYVPVHDRRGRWAVVRSLSKILGPDLRVALVAGDEQTIARVEGRQLVGAGWVSHLLQQLTVELLTRPAAARVVSRAEHAYASRRSALLDALDARGIAASGASGLGVWVPLTEESATTQELLERGWAVSPGERFRLRTPPGIRITTTTLEPREAKAFARALDEVLSASGRTYAA